MGDAIKVNVQPFQAAMKEYARFDRRTMPEIINAKLGDWAWEAAKLSPAAMKSTIKNLPNSFRDGAKGWWKFVQSVYSSGFVLKGRRKATEEESRVGYSDRATGKWISRRKTLSTFRTTGQSKHRKGDLSRVAKSIINRRAATVKSFAAQFLFAALKLGKNVGMVGGKNSWKYQGVYTNKAVSEMEKPSGYFSIPWRARTLENKRHDGKRSKREQEKLMIATVAVERARNNVVADMQRKTAERYARKAAQLSGRSV